MTIIVVGCGRVGSRLANMLDRMGHDVSVVDRDEDTFSNLDDDFSGLTITGVPIDQQVLLKAGIENCDALAAVSPDDNVNAMAGQIATEIFNVPKVLARISDPNRENVFSQFNLNTICPTNLSVDALFSHLTDTSPVKYVSFGSDTLSFEVLKMPKHSAGLHTSQLPAIEGKTLFALLHGDGSIELIHRYRDLVVSEEDKLIYASVLD